MKKISLMVALLAFLPFPSKAFETEAVSGGRFERQMFAPTIFGTFGSGQQKAASLSQQEKQRALSARKVLIQFLRTAQKPSSDVKNLVDADFLSRFTNQREMLDKLFGQESEVLIATVTDFQTLKKDEVELAYYVVLFSEGRMLIREDRALLRHKGQRWLISRIGGTR